MAGAPEAPALKRALGRWDLTAIGVNQVIGSAIFLLSADVARLVGAWGPLAFMGVGLLSLSIALCFAEAGSRFEKTGGPYLPARAAFGRFVGFEVGWMLWFTRVTSQASVANGLALALAFYWPALAIGVPRMSLIAGLTIALTRGSTCAASSSRRGSSTRSPSASWRRSRSSSSSACGTSTRPASRPCRR